MKINKKREKKIILNWVYILLYYIFGNHPSSMKWYREWIFEYISSVLEIFIMVDWLYVNLNAKQREDAWI